MKGVTRRREFTLFKGSAGIFFFALLFFVLQPNTSHADVASLRNGLINYWTFDGIASTTASVSDKSPGQCNTATKVNTPSLAVGHYGDANNALLFNGTSQYIDVPETTARLDDGAFSISAWIRPTTVSGLQYIDQDWRSDKQNYYLARNGTAINFRVGNGKGNADAVMSGGTLAINTWYHVVAVVNGTSHKLYVNGVEVATQNGSYKGGSSNDYTNNPVYRRIGAGDDLTGYFQGSIDEVMHYNRALTAAEATELYTLSAANAAQIQVPASPQTPPLFPVIEAPPVGYSFAPFLTYKFPLAHSGTGPSSESGNMFGNNIEDYEVNGAPVISAHTPSGVSALWYANTPSPLTCYRSSDGKCMYLGDIQGTRIEMLKATPQINYSSGSSAYELQEGLVGYWSFDTADVSGTTAYDVSGNNNHGNLLNTPTPLNAASSKINESMSFSGGSNEAASLGAPADLNLTGSFSIAAWIRPTNFGGNNEGRIYDKSSLGGGGPDTGSGFTLYVEDGTITNNGMELIIHGADSTATIRSNDNAITLSTWQHVAATYNASTEVATLYVNGVAVGTGSSTPPVDSTGANAYIGRESYAANLDFNGGIDELSLYNRALFGGEVAQLASLTSATISQARPSGNFIAPVFSGLDLISSTTPANICGVKQTHWLYAGNNSANTLFVPRYTQVEVKYSCQPSQDYFWYTREDGDFSYDGSATEQRIFRFADRSKLDGTPSSLLSSTKVVSVANTATFSLQCGGYKPEEGTQIGLRPYLGTPYNDCTRTIVINDFNMNDSGPWGGDDGRGYGNKRPDYLPMNVGLPPYYGLSYKGNNGTCSYWPWSWAYYNAASTTYYHPSITLNVQACQEGEVVVGGTCQACPAGQYVSGNSCVANAPPTATIDAGRGNGATTSVAIGATVNVRATYTPSVGDGVMKKVYLTSGTSWTVPSDWDSANNTIEVIGGGGGGRTQGDAGGYGGGGGAYAKISNLTFTPGATVTYQVGSGGAAGVNGSDTFFNRTSGTATTCTAGAMSACAKGGLSGSSNGIGGALSTSIGSVKFAGGNGGSYGVDAGGGGGGAASLYDKGANGGTGSSVYASNPAGGGGGASGGGFSGTDGANNIGGTGGNNYLNAGGGAGAVRNTATPATAGTAGGGGGGGAKGGSTYAFGAVGGAGTEWEGTYGAGGGGGGGSDTTGGNGGMGGLYGGGGGGGRTGGSGANGIIVISYAGTGADTITATAINDDSTGNSVDCGKVTYNPTPVSTTTHSTNDGCENLPELNKTYSFVANQSGTTTYSAQIKTTSYQNYNSYGTVAVVVCPLGQMSNGSGGCMVADLCTDVPGVQSTVPPGAGCLTPNPTPGICIPSGYNWNGTACVAAPAVIDNFYPSPARVRAGTASTLYWKITNVPAVGGCTITSTPSGFTYNITAANASSSQPTNTINRSTDYTLNCGTGVTQKKTVTIAPAFQEI